MKGLIKIIGTNGSTKHLQNLVFENCILQSKGKIHDLILDDKKYFLDIKETHFHPEFLLVFGMISDDADFVGNIALEFHQKNNS